MEGKEGYARPKEIYQRIRCMQCTTRINLEPGQRIAPCPQCGLKWVIAWVTPDIPMVLRRVVPSMNGEA